MKYYEIKIFIRLPSKCQRILDVTGYLTDNEVKHVTTSHIALLFTAHITILVHYFFNNGICRTHLTITASGYHNQVCTRTIGIE